MVWKLTLIFLFLNPRTPIKKATRKQLKSLEADRRYRGLLTIPIYSPVYPRVHCIKKWFKRGDSARSFFFTHTFLHNDLWKPSEHDTVYQSASSRHWAISEQELAKPPWLIGNRSHLMINMNIEDEKKDDLAESIYPLSLIRVVLYLVSRGGTTANSRQRCQGTVHLSSNSEKFLNVFSKIQLKLNYFLSLILSVPRCLNQVRNWHNFVSSKLRRHVYK